MRNQDGKYVAKRMCWYVMTDWYAVRNVSFTVLSARRKVRGTSILARETVSSVVLLVFILS